MKIKGILLDSDCLLFRSQTSHGVSWVSPAMFDEAERLAALVGRKIRDWGGGGGEEFTCAYFDTPITEEEAEVILAELH